MRKISTLRLLPLISVIVFLSCNNHDAPHNRSIGDSSITVKTNNPFKGTWIQHDSIGFRMIEIIDSQHVTFFILNDRLKDIGDTSSDRYFYYKSKATIGHWNENSIWIGTDRFRFDYYVHGDTLIEFDKMGEQGKFVKVFTDKQKDFITFDSTTLRGELTFINNVGFSELFSLNNADNEYRFSSIKTNNSGNRLFSDVAEVGDSVIKAAYADTLFLFKKASKKHFTFIFEND